MKLRTAICGAAFLGSGAVHAAGNGLPVDKVYGVNLGSWLLSEPWMFPNEWKAMGGEICADCSKCAMSEFDLTRKLGQARADEVFAKHWANWFTQADVNRIADAGLNTVRIPLGYWIVEDLVDRSTEFYPRGGLKYLKQGLRMLKAKGINVILDFHALPGVASPNQMFAGRCTSDVQFYTEKNYNRALNWTRIMTTMIHTDPDFSTVFALEAINEPVSDYNKTPGLGNYEKNFVKVVRHTEQGLGIQCSQVESATEPIVDVHLKRGAEAINDSNTPAGRGANLPVGAGVGNVEIPHGSSIEKPWAKRRAHRARGISVTQNKRASGKCLMTTFMNKDWQHNNPANPADAADGPQLYDAHLYFSFGGVADPNPDSYMRNICNTDRVAQAVAERNTPLVFGEWSLATNFNASNAFLHDWSDAQRHIYAGQADGWIFWSFKIEKGSPYIPAWSYFDALDAGYFRRDPSQLTNPNVCDKWMENDSS
ncbi:hypothetical protein FS749_007077 [Ceratobasidium sp. UAMH 11750]|nr:hypothetical protein FS749_007077 [Ceratobasidium sp. UAMH 11750]